MNFAYVRVSTIEQNEERQIEALEPRKIDKWYIEKVSGKNMNGRPKLNEMLAEVSEGDTVFIHDFSRLARSTKDLLNIVEILTEKGVHLVSNKESIDTGTPAGKLMLTMIGAIAEFERANMLERQREGIIIAMRKGVYKNRCGRKRKDIDLRIVTPQYEKFLAGTMTKKDFAKVIGVSRPTLDKMLKRGFAS